MLSSRVRHSIQLSGNLFVEYQVRVSRRARNVRLKISASEGLTITAPHAFELSRIPDLLETKKRWIASHLERFAAAKAFAERTPEEARPGVITLPALGETWRVDYCETQARSVVVLSRGDGKLVVRGAIGDERACRVAMRRWLARRAKDRIVPWLRQLGEQHGLLFSRVMIKGQKTRWGSCSRRKTISLNYKLLFLSPPAVRYILIHELCHTRQMNHSNRFWTLVRALEPDYRDRVKELRQGPRRVPAWAGHGLDA